jgi:hypothetical protein
MEAIFVKKIITSCFALALTLMCTISAYAMEVPTATTVQNLNGVQQYIKVYTVAPEMDPQELVEEPFDYEGFTYTFSSIVKQENFFSSTETHIETVTVETEKNDLSVVLAALDPTMQYDDGHYSGTLSLNHSTLQTQTAGYVSKSYTITTTKEIDNLDSNDMAYIPPTTVKDGKTIPLTSVDWQVQGTALVDDILVPSQYKAVATYTGKASRSVPTGYLTTAEYIGEVSCSEVESVTYTVTYVGQEILEEGESPTMIDGMISVVETYWPILLGGFAVATLATVGGVIVVRKSKKNARNAGGM